MAEELGWDDGQEVVTEKLRVSGVGLEQTREVWLAIAQSAGAPQRLLSPTPCLAVLGPGSTTANRYSPCP